MDNVKLFYSKILQNEELLARFNKIIDETGFDPEDEVTLQQLDELVRKLHDLSQAVGVEITVEDLKQYVEEFSNADNETAKLTYDELEQVAGGEGGQVDKDANDEYTKKCMEDAEELKKDISAKEDLVINEGPVTEPVTYGKCFAADSKISTPSGTRIISDIKVGDEVISLDVQNNKVVSKVIEVRPVADEEIYKVEFSNGATWFTTATQWFYCGDDDYACAIDSKGKAALTEDGASATVIKFEKTGNTQKVYDFIVDGVNVFFVEGIAAQGY